jgi:predicted nuclease with RNAse H fold
LVGDLVITVGIDLAARPERSRVCEITWSGAPQVRLLDDCRTNERLRALVQNAADEGVSKIGIDCPLGWPQDFVAAVSRYHGRAGWPTPAAAHERSLEYRLTDYVVKQRVEGAWPLSVSADRLGVVAFRCAEIISGMPSVDRTGCSGPVAEVYPAAALRQWGLVDKQSVKEHGSYKRSRAALLALFSRLATALPLDYSKVADACQTNHDAFDALVCAVIARAVERGMTEAPAEHQRAAAEVEGWIHLPATRPLQQQARELLG